MRRAVIAAALAGAGFIVFAPGLTSDVVESITGAPECAPVTDRTGDGKADVSIFDYYAMPDHCWPDHPDYVQP